MWAIRTTTSQKQGEENVAAVEEGKGGGILRLTQAHLSNRVPLCLWPSPVRMVALGDGFKHPVRLKGGCTNSNILREEVISFSVLNKHKDGRKKQTRSQFLAPFSLLSLAPCPCLLTVVHRDLTHFRPAVAHFHPASVSGSIVVSTQEPSCLHWFPDGPPAFLSSRHALAAWLTANANYNNNSSNAW